jgi:hypothetical protein
VLSDSDVNHLFSDSESRLHYFAVAMDFVQMSPHSEVGNNDSEGREKTLRMACGLEASHHLLSQFWSADVSFQLDCSDTSAQRCSTPDSTSAFAAL